MINEALVTSEKPLKVRVAQIGSSQARLSFSDNQSVEINKKYLPKNAKVGTELYLNLLTDEDLHKTKSQIANQILENILSSDEG